MNIRNHVSDRFTYVVDVYLKHEKLFIALFLVTFLSTGFYYVDWHNHLLWKEGMKFYNLTTFIDRSIPFTPGWVWIYLLYYPFCFTPLFLLNNIDTFRRVAAAYLLEFIIAFIVFLSFPVRMIRPEIVPVTLSEKIVEVIYRVDPGFNVFPSLHVANSFLVALIFYRYNRTVGIIFIFIAVLISISTLFVKQHYFFDVVTGLLDVAVVYPFVFYGHRPVKWQKNII
jgi:membrane-associated phospholipid phosphatase